MLQFFILLLIIFVLAYMLFVVEGFQINCLYPASKMSIEDSYQSLSKGRCYNGEPDEGPIDNIPDEGNVSGEKCLIGGSRLNASRSYGSDGKGFCRTPCITGGDGKCK